MYSYMQEGICFHCRNILLIVGRVFYTRICHKNTGENISLAFNTWQKKSIGIYKYP